MLYILNSATLPLKPGKEYVIHAKELTIEEAKELLENERFISAVGHEATAKMLTNIFGVEISMNRIQIFLDDGDKLLSIILKTRLEEGKVIKTVEELEQIGYNIWLFEVVTYVHNAKYE
ncbi:conserved crenarchaeal viral protein [Sulfolobus islandicus filamentous virus 2]|uniref:Conserved crenarchaeal viral protein n=1 Tax=Sulfolobus islandicus filamentous virus 2 TaxID=1902331 RepID=A0A1D8BJ77_SIFV|nr:conserved crenarchaeal viral protein [Sulfolobus islandicus filamentous virus 2]